MLTHPFITSHSTPVVLRSFFLLSFRFPLVLPNSALKSQSALDSGRVGFLVFPHPSLFPYLIMRPSTILLAAVVSLVPSARAHGFVYILGVDGNNYKGNIPEGSNDTPSPIRQVSQQDPIYGATSPTVNCGTGAPNAALVVDAMPGSKLSWDWRTEALTAWPHDTGAFPISSAIHPPVFLQSYLRLPRPDDDLPGFLRVYDVRSVRFQDC